MWPHRGGPGFAKRAGLAQAMAPKEGDALERALFELGSVYEEDSQPVRALEVFGRLVSEFPGTPWSSDAVQRAERIERYVGQGPREE